MKLKLVREKFLEDRTIGTLYVNDEFECFTLEDAVREQKIMHKTAIPEGTYEVIINLSPKFGKLYPRLLDVPGFTGILIHAGNGPEDTSGCILVGEAILNDRIRGGSSTPAYTRLFEKMLAAQSWDDPLSIEVTHKENP